MASLQAKADAVKAALASTSTSTPTTVVTVKELLLPDAETTSTTSQTTTRTARSNTIPKTKKNGTGRSTAAKAVASAQPDQMAIKDRAALATHVINITIKSLTEAAKPPPPETPSKRQPSHNELRKAPGQRTLRRSLSAPLSPIQPRTLNRTATSPNIGSKATTTQPAAHSTGCLATVECARTAFACLRSIKGPVQANQTDFQLENGMSAFVGKLLALGLQEQAIKELRILKRRLGAATSKDAAKTAKSAPAESQTAAQVIAELLDYDGPIPDQSLPIITTCQIQVVRLIALSKKPAQIEAALPFLRESHPSSPLNLLQKLAGLNDKEGQKAARQLASLSQILLSLAPSVSSKEDHVATESRLSPSPSSAFQLQVLCFRAQLRWWKLAGHRGVVDDDVLSPFTRCIRAFTRRQPTGDGTTFTMISTSFDALMELVRSQQSQPRKSSDSPLATIYQLLGVAAHTERQYEEAHHWFKQLKDLMQPEQDSFVRVCSISARLLAAALKKPLLDRDADKLVLEIVESLDGSLSGSVSELNELLESLSLARRSAVGLLVSKINEKNSGDSSKILIDHLKSFLVRYPRFARRWLGAPPARDSSAKLLLQFDQRRQVLMQTISQVLDGALMVVNSDIQADSITWQDLDDILQDCAKLLESVADPMLSAPRADQLGSYYVKMSSLYFSKFTQLRKITGKSKDISKQILQTLSRSIELVKDRPPAQQEKAQLSIKLELFADLCKGAGRGNDAVRTLRSICTNMIEEGALLKVTAAMASQAPSVAWSVDEKAETLSRTLRSIAKLDHSWNDWAFFLPEAERAAVLEHLMEISNGTSAQGKPLKIHDPCVGALLRLYTLDRFPIRRLRVLLNLLFQNLGEGSEMEKIGALADEAMLKSEGKSTGEDAALARYVPHLQAYHGSVSAMAVSRAPFPAAAMKNAIASWRSMTETCHSRDDFHEKIDNPDSLLAHLQSASQFASLRGENTLHLSILELSTTISKVLAEPTYNNVILNHTLLASQHLNIGHYSEAKRTLEVTKELLEQAERPSRGIVAAFHLSQAEYYTGIGSIDEANSSLAFAKEIYNGPTSSWALSKSQANLALALASFLDSTLALKQGRVQDALSCIKSSVRVLSHDWSKFEVTQSRDGTPSELNTSTSSIDSVKGTSLGQVIGPRFWALAFPLLRGLLHISSVYAHLGMFQETIYYAESAQKIAESTGSPLYRAQVLAWTGSIYHRAGKLEKALDFGNEAGDQMPEDICVSRIQLACQLSDLYRDIGDEEKAASMLKLAEETTQRLGGQGKLLNGLEGIEKPTTTIVKGRTTAAAKTTRTTRTTRAKAAPTPAPRTRKRVTTAKTPSSVDAVLSLPKDVYQASLMASIILSRALSFINQKDWTSALSTLEDAKELPKLFGTLSQEQVVTAISLIGHSTEQMIHDPVFSVVQDSTISFPAVSSSDKSVSRRASISQTPPRRGRTAAGSADRKGSKERGVPAFADALRQAQELLLEAHASTLSTASSTMVHRISALLQNTVILLSATSTTQSKVLAGSGFATFSVDLARNVTWRREQSTLLKDGAQTQTKAREPPQSSRRVSLGLTTEMAKFQKNYVELVPHNWSVISVSLSDNRHDLCITKFQAGHSPFILRLPLERANSRDADSEVFNFEQGREEMLEIIQLANESSHSASRDFTAKGARSAWWAEREALDSRLQDLLSNIETTWLGGFKGIFSQHERRPDLLARFQKSFQQILDSSLPSRNRIRGKKTAKTPKVSLDPRILDLFIGLGDPTDPDVDFDEALNDLLYFVVDILQFHGERNAYDEIDFDAMVVETYDALRGYYAATKSGAVRMDDAHTVLVLDKALHAFPWESMPCMEGLAVSRVPSLACLRQLILESQPAKTATEDDARDLPEGHYVSADRGTYILNPSTDLKNTQVTFQASLKALPSWKGIVNRAPEEAEFEQALSSSEILLYFGHGSGAQYVRARTVRRLEKCKPATFLMGCSSASLTEAGEFECYGPVWNYMMAGCPAVVGTLWDVTDRDIDRLAGRSFEEWGLVPKGTFQEEKRGKGKATASSDDESDDDEDEFTRHVSLVEAVARARAACRFKYLNAAAVVLYGIPVYINRGGE
ncbi:peptidase family C50-domain-containing protein [Ilyonectria robusta]|uniref:peptidase family C50-domain-containing protein n=1 Tax=Ilyonectria robusta TaxID=1079257 RepID=UPI001E8E12A0|nr:peptidase family C50-domain-containing protein [Ilyonectria robusta]KAH8686804.1 peptidase family C50-domain-containing protein [Ilyonectria robusta]